MLVLATIILLLILPSSSHYLLSVDHKAFRAVTTYNAMVLVSFQSPWCDQCLKMLGELHRVGEELHEDGIDVKVAIYDVTAEGNKELARQEKVVGYPTLVLYRQGGGRVGVYDGSRSWRDIYEYLRKRSGVVFTPVSTLREVHEYNSIVSTEDIFGGGFMSVVLGLFPAAPKESNRGVHGRAFQVYHEVAGMLNAVKFLVADNAKLLAHFGVENDTVLIFTGGDTVKPTGRVTAIGRDRDNGAQDLMFDILRYSLPLVINFNSKTAATISLLPIKRHVLLFFPPAMIATLARDVEGESGADRVTSNGTADSEVATDDDLDDFGDIDDDDDVDGVDTDDDDRDKGQCTMDDQPPTTTTTRRPSGTTGARSGPGPVAVDHSSFDDVVKHLGEGENDHDRGDDHETPSAVPTTTSGGSGEGRGGSFGLLDADDMAPPLVAPPAASKQNKFEKHQATKSTQKTSKKTSKKKTTKKQTNKKSTTKPGYSKVVAFDAADQPLVDGTLPEEFVEYEVTVDGLRRFNYLMDSVIESFRGFLVFIRIPATQHALMQYFDVVPETLPSVMAVDATQQHDIKRYLFNDYLATMPSYVEALQADAELTPDTHESDSLYNFLWLFLENKLSRQMISESEETVNLTQSSVHTFRPTSASRVVKLTGETFSRAVSTSPRADLFVYFFAPWCAHCKAFETVIHQLANAVKHDDTIQIARIDASKNDIHHPGVEVRGFPTFYFFPTDEPDNPQEYDGEQSLASILRFIHFHRSKSLVAHTELQPDHHAAAHIQAIVEFEEEARKIEEVQEAVMLAALEEVVALALETLSAADETTHVPPPLTE